MAATKKSRVLQLAGKRKKPFTLADLAMKADCTAPHVRECLLDAGYEIVEWQGNTGLWAISK